MQTRAALLRQMGLPRPYAHSQPLRIETLDLANPGPGECRVRVTAAGLCHSDLSVIEGVRRGRCRWCLATRQLASSKHSGRHH